MVKIVISIVFVLMCGCSGMRSHFEGIRGAYLKQGNPNQIQTPGDSIFTPTRHVSSMNKKEEVVNEGRIPTKFIVE